MFSEISRVKLPVKTGRSFTLIKFTVTSDVVAREPPSVTVTERVYELLASKLSVLIDRASPVQHVTADVKVITPVVGWTSKRLELDALIEYDSVAQVDPARSGSLAMSAPPVPPQVTCVLGSELRANVCSCTEHD